MLVTVIRERLQLNEKKALENLEKKINLRFSGRFRWNILMTLIVFAFFALPFFIPLEVLFGINCYFVLLWFIYFISSLDRHVRSSLTLKRYNKSLEEKKLPTVSEKIDNKYKYMMATFAYKEPIEMIQNILRNIRDINGSEELIMAVCLEERTPKLEEKIDIISKEFGEYFQMLYITVHPYGVVGEIPGKCSNSNYGIRSVFESLKSKDPKFNSENYILINCDIDTVFHKGFLDITKETVLKEKNVSNIVWQPLLYYNWNFDKLSFFTRIIGIVRSTVMAGALVTFNLNVMSVFCASLKLYEDGNFVHPFYQMDDIICYIRWMIKTKKLLKIKPIYCPTISGPTSGENWWEELKEFIIQSKRWAIGSAEVFHYFMCKLTKIKVHISIIWGINYLNYYCGFLCIQSMLFISGTIRIAVLEHGDTWLTLSFIAFPIWLFFINFFMVIVNKIAVWSFLRELNVKENLGFFREVLHIILTIPTQIFYSFVILYGFFSILVHGKNVCKHRASNKDNLV